MFAHTVAAKLGFDIGKMEDFFQILPSDFKFAVEFRNLSWIAGETWRLLESYNVAYTVVDEPLLPPEIRVTANFAYVRWHGKGLGPWYNYRYNREELEPWVPKVEEISGNTEAVYGYFNNHYHGYAVENCLQVLEMLGGLTPSQVKAKKNVETYMQGKTKLASTKQATLTISKESVESLLGVFLDEGRLTRSKEIKDEDIQITDITEDHISVKIREYHLELDLRNKRIIHDCADWNRSITSKSFCKHLGKTFLKLPEQKSTKILKIIISEKEKWSFESFTSLERARAAVLGIKIIDEQSFRNRIHVFEDRFHAGELLAKKLIGYKGKQAYVLAIPAGGVQVAYVVAKTLKLPLDVVVTRKIHVPWNKEAGFGAITWDGRVFLNEPLVSVLGLTREVIDQCITEEREAIKRRLEMFRGEKPLPNLRGKAVILVDDGLASGFSMLATLTSIKMMTPKEIIVAIPTASPDALERIRRHTDKIICLNIRSGPVFAVADAYKTWYDLTEEDVIKILSDG